MCIWGHVRTTLKFEVHLRVCPDRWKVTMICLVLTEGDFSLGLWLRNSLWHLPGKQGLCFVGTEMNVRWFLGKSDIELPGDPAVFLLDAHPEEGRQALPQTRVQGLLAHAPHSQTLAAAQPPATEKQASKSWCKHAVGYRSA